MLSGNYVSLCVCRNSIRQTEDRGRVSRHSVDVEAEKEMLYVPQQDKSEREHVKGKRNLPNHRLSCTWRGSFGKAILHDLILTSVPCGSEAQRTSTRILRTGQRIGREIIMGNVPHGGKY
ncbi:uncharacterized protein LOC135394869 [Ornithodoros turicata]|uniref:uncharacterized protein LOC135394869 n=1 Tax=Ornithodoros turicata TaxID=34597 RepID=UPI00313A1D93